MCGPREIDREDFRGREGIDDDKRREEDKNLCVPSVSGNLQLLHTHTHTSCHSGVVSGNAGESQCVKHVQSERPLSIPSLCRDT